MELVELAKKLIENYLLFWHAKTEIKDGSGKKLGINSKFIEVDLSSYKSIDDFSNYLRHKNLTINYLVNNAGVMFHPNYFLENGINVTFFIITSDITTYQ